MAIIVGMLLYIADLGGARDASDPNTNLRPRQFTFSFIAIPDMDELARLSQLTHSRDAIIYLEKQRDVFAMGLILYTSLTKKTLPYKKKLQRNPVHNVESTEFLDLNSNYKEINNPNVPQEIKVLIKQMLDPNYRNRPTAAQVLTRLQACAQSNL